MEYTEINLRSVKAHQRHDNGCDNRQPQSHEKQPHAPFGIIVRQTRGYAGYHYEQRRKVRLCRHKKIQQLCSCLHAENLGHAVKRVIEHHAEHRESPELVEHMYSLFALCRCHLFPPVF